MTDEHRPEEDESTVEPEHLVVETDQVRGVDLLVPAADDGDPLAGLAGAGLEISDDLTEQLEDAEAAAVETDGLDSADVPPPPEVVADAPDGVTRPWVADRRLYVAEANALAGRQSERAALMYLEAVRVGDRTAEALDVMLGDLDAALELQPDAAWLLARARRAAMRLRSYERALKLGRREVELDGESHRGAAVLVEAAAVARCYVGKAGTALQLIKRALKLKPGHVPALARAVALSHELKQPQEAREALEQLGNSVTAAKQRSLCLYSAGALLEALLDDEDAAQAAYNRSVEADPQNAPAVQALAELHAQREEWSAYAQTLEHLADLVDDEQLRAKLLLTAGTVQLERNDDAEAAIRLLERSSRDDRSNEAPLNRLVTAYLLRGRTREAIEVLRQRLDERFEREPGEQAALYARLGELCAALPDEQQAEAAFRKALELAPGYAPAHRALEQIYRQRGDFAALVEVSKPDAELLPDKARAARFFVLGGIHEDRLESPDAAIEAHLRALEIDGGLHPAYSEATRLLRGVGRHEEHRDLLERQAEVATDDKTRAGLLLDRARVEAGPLGAADRAAEALLSLDRSTEPRSIARELIDLCAATGRHAELVELLLEQAAATSDPAEADGAKVRAALVLFSRLDSPDRALEILREVIDRDPLSYVANQTAARILEQQQAHNDLVKLLHQQLAKDPERPDGALLLCRMARILATELGNGGAAVSAYVKAVRTDPRCAQAIAALDGLAPCEGRFEDLVKALEVHAGALEEGRAAAAVLARAGELACWRLDDLDRARVLFEKGAERGGAPAWPGLLRTRLRQRDYAGAAELLEQMVEGAQSDTERSMLRLHLARLKEYRLAEPPDLTLYQQAAEGSYVGDRLREELVRVHRLTVDSAESRTDMAARLVALGRETIDDTLAAAYLLEAAHTLELSSGGESGSSEVLLEAATLAYKAEPHDFATIWCLERELLRQQMWPELAELAEREAQLELDRRVRLMRLTSAADAFHRAGLNDDVVRVCRECLNFDAHCLPALLLLAEVAEQGAQWRRLAELCDRLAEASADLDNRLTFCLRAAELWCERVEDSSRALASLAVALADDPGNPAAFALAERLLRERRDFDELSRLYQRRIRACQAEQDEVELLRAHAHLLRDDCGQADRALAALNELLKLAPRDEQALVEVAALHEQQGHWSDAASALSALAARAPDLPTRHEALLRQARILVRQLHEIKRARRVLELLVEEQPGQPEASRLLAEIALERGDWEEARPLLEQLAEAGSAAVEQRIWALFGLAELGARAGGGGGSEPGADPIRRALAVADEGADGRSALKALVLGARAPQRLLTEIEAALDDSASSELGELIAAICVELGERPRAILHLRRLLGSSSDKGLALTLARLLEQEHDHAEALRRYRLLIEEDAGMVEAYAGVARTAPDHVARSAASVVAALGNGELDDELQAVLAEAVGGVPEGRFEAPALELGTKAVDASQAQLLEELLRLAASSIDEELGTGGAPGRALGGDEPLAVTTAALARALGFGAVGVERASGDDVRAAGDVDRPVVRVPAALVDACGSPAGVSAVTRFWVGRALFIARRAGPAGPGLGAADVQRLVAALGEPKPRTAGAQQLRKALFGRMPRKLRKQVDALAAGRLGEGFVTLYWTALEAHATRLALVLARLPGDPLVALAAKRGVERAGIVADDELAALLREVLTDSWGALCGQVWR